MKINGQEVSAKEFAYDGCHKIYLIENEQDRVMALEYEYDLYPISELSNKWYNSCDLRFINNWSLTKTYVEQFEEQGLVIT